MTKILCSHCLTHPDNFARAMTTLRRWTTNTESMGALGMRVLNGDRLRYALILACTSRPARMWRYGYRMLAKALQQVSTFSSRLARAVALCAACSLLPACAATPTTNARPDEAYVKAAWAYFKNKCATEAGEKIYKTFTGVKSVLIVKPLPSATDKDHFDQFWYGDPYSAPATSVRRDAAVLKLVMDWKHRSGTGSQRGLDFVEMKNKAREGYTRIYRPESNAKLSIREQLQQPVSSFGVAWEDISTMDDRKYWVARSRFRVVDLNDNSVVAERIGYLIEAGFGSTSGGRRPWLTSRGIGPNGRSCPDAHDATDQWFITTVFTQEQGK